jgi:hypothetical protein
MGSNRRSTLHYSGHHNKPPSSTEFCLSSSRLTMGIGILPIELFERILHAVWELSVDPDYRIINQADDRPAKDFPLLYPCCVDLALVCKQWYAMLYARRNAGLFWIMPMVIEDSDARLEKSLVQCTAAISRSLGCDIYLSMRAWANGPDGESDPVPNRLAIHGTMRVLRHAKRLDGLYLSVDSPSSLASLLCILASMESAPRLRRLEIFFAGLSLEEQEIEQIDILWQKCVVRTPPRLDFLNKTCPNLHSFACRYLDPIPIKNIPCGIRYLEYSNEISLAWEPNLNQLDEFWACCPSLERTDLYFFESPHQISIRRNKGRDCNIKQLSLRCNLIQAISILTSFKFPNLQRLKMTLRSEGSRIPMLQGSPEILEEVFTGLAEPMLKALEEVEIRVITSEWYDPSELSYLSLLAKQMKIKQLKICLDSDGEPVRSLQLLQVIVASKGVIGVWSTAGQTIESLEINCYPYSTPRDVDEWKLAKTPDGIRMDSLKQLTLNISLSDYLHQFSQTVTVPLLTNLTVVYGNTRDVNIAQESSHTSAELEAESVLFFGKLAKVSVDVENLRDVYTDTELWWLKYLLSLENLVVNGIEKDCGHILLLQRLFAQDQVPFTRLRHVAFGFKWGVDTSLVLSYAAELLKSIADLQDGREFHITLLSFDGDVLWESHSSWSGDSQHLMLLGGLSSSTMTEGELECSLLSPLGL